MAEHAVFAGGGWRLRLGMLLPSSNTVAEADVAAMLPTGCALHTTRLRLTGSGREEMLAMAAGMEEGARLIADAEPDLIVFHCTAVSTLDPDLGEDVVRRIERLTGRPATATSRALLSAFAALGARRIALLTPYVAEVNASEIAFLAHHGIVVAAERGLGCRTGVDMAGIEPGAWYRHAMAMRREDVDAYFISCTTIRVSPVITALERDLGRPVITSNQAMAWHCLRRAGIAEPVPGYGRLFGEACAPAEHGSTLSP